MDFVTIKMEKEIHRTIVSCILKPMLKYALPFQILAYAQNKKN